MAPTPLAPAYHGDSWESPRWAVAIRGARITPPLETWTIRAQARRYADEVTPTFEWTVAGGGIVLGSAMARLSNGTELELDNIQLRMRPADWVGMPTEWRGVLDVELNSDDTAAPAERHTVVRKLPFEVVADIAR